MRRGSSDKGPAPTAAAGGIVADDGRASPAARTPGGARLRNAAGSGLLQCSVQSDLSLVGGSSYVMYPSLGGSTQPEPTQGKTYTVTAEGGVIETQGCTLLP
jgi:hypothetical protein